MKYALLMLFSFVAFFVFGNAQADSPSPSAASSSIGPHIGEKAPVFTASDQFGRKQTNETLRGSNGTVLLFFRSADW